MGGVVKSMGIDLAKVIRHVSRGFMLGGLGGALCIVAVGQDTVGIGRATATFILAFCVGHCHGVASRAMEKR